MIDIATLSPEERLRRLEQLSDRLSPNPEANRLTEPQREALDRRLDELERDGPTGIPADEVLNRLRSASK
jgi:putative addiction module component (TIGR02574 family)